MKKTQTVLFRLPGDKQTLWVGLLEQDRRFKGDLKVTVAGTEFGLMDIKIEMYL